MIRANEIQECLLHLIGWEQNYDVSNFSIAENLTQSETGLYFQQIHPLLTLQNIKCIAPDFDNIKFPIYSPGTHYPALTIVSNEDGQLYKAIKDNIGHPLTDTTCWVPIDLFSDWLEKKTKASIQKAISCFISDKLAKGSAKNLLENRPLFDGTGRIVDTIDNKNNLVGFEITPIRAKGITTKLNKICLQFTEPGDYTIYIMHSSSSSPMHILHLTKTKKNTAEWFDLENIYLPYSGKFQDAGGSWYVCYLQSELPPGSKAIRKNRDWSKGPCSACSRYEYTSWLVWSKYIEVVPFHVNEELICRGEDAKVFYDSETQALVFNEGAYYDEVTQALVIDANIAYYDNSDDSIVFTEQTNIPSMWDLEYNQYDDTTNYGLNLDISIACDLTDFIIEQRHLFKDIIARQLAVDMLREFAYNANVRTNRHSINASRVDILYELDGDSASMKRSGLSMQLENAFKALELSTEGLDRVCQPCVNHGIKYRTV